MGYKYQMSNVKVQMKFKNQMKKFIKERILDIESFWHSLDSCLPARSRFGEGRDFEIWI
jgi:hypothetical protein